LGPQDDKANAKMRTALTNNKPLLFISSPLDYQVYNMELRTSNYLSLFSPPFVFIHKANQIVV